jgi:hypothetical protein
MTHGYECTADLKETRHQPAAAFALETTTYELDACFYSRRSLSPYVLFGMDGWCGCGKSSATDPHVFEKSREGIVIYLCVCRSFGRNKVADYMDRLNADDQAHFVNYLKLLKELASTEEIKVEEEKLERMLRDGRGIFLVSPESLHLYIDKLRPRRQRVLMLVLDELTAISDRPLCNTMQQPFRCRALPIVASWVTYAIACCGDWKSHGGVKCNEALAWLFRRDPDAPDDEDPTTLQPYSENGEAAEAREAERPAWKVDLAQLKRMPSRLDGYHKLFFFTKDAPPGRTKEDFFRYLHYTLGFYREGGPMVGGIVSCKPWLDEVVQMGVQLGINTSHYYGQMERQLLEELEDPAIYWRASGLMAGTTVVGYGSNPSDDHVRLRFEVHDANGALPASIDQSGGRMSRVREPECKLVLSLVVGSPADPETSPPSFEKAMIEVERRRDDMANEGAAKRRRAIIAIARSSKSYLQVGNEEPDLTCSTYRQRRVYAQTLLCKMRAVHHLYSEVLNSARVHGYSVDQIAAEVKLHAFLRRLSPTDSLPLPVGELGRELLLGLNEQAALAFEHLNRRPVEEWAGLLVQATRKNGFASQLENCLATTYGVLRFISGTLWSQLGPKEVVELAKNKLAIATHVYGMLCVPDQLCALQCWAAHWLPSQMAFAAKEFEVVHDRMKMLEEFRELAMGREVQSMYRKCGTQNSVIGYLNGTLIAAINTERRKETNAELQATETRLRKIYARVAPDSGARGVKKLCTKILATAGLELSMSQRRVDYHEESTTCEPLPDLPGTGPDRRRRLELRAQQQQQQQQQEKAPTTSCGNGRVQCNKVVSAYLQNFTIVSPFDTSIQCTYRDWEAAHRPVGGCTLDAEPSDEEERALMGWGEIRTKVGTGELEGLHGSPDAGCIQTYLDGSYLWKPGSRKESKAKSTVGQEELVCMEALERCMAHAARKRELSQDSEDKKSADQAAAQMKKIFSKVKNEECLPGLPDGWRVRRKTTRYGRKTVVGRMFCTNDTQATLYHEYRTEMGRGLTQMADFDNCHVRLAVNFPSFFGGPAVNIEEEYPCFLQLIRDKKGVRRAVEEWYNFRDPRKACREWHAKNMILIGLYDGDISYFARKKKARNPRDMPWLVGFHAECLRLQDVWLALPMWQTKLPDGQTLLQALETQARNKHGEEAETAKIRKAMFSYLLGGVEDMAINLCFGVFTEMGWRINLRIFDGFTAYFADVERGTVDLERTADTALLQEAIDAANAKVREVLKFELPLRAEAMFGAPPLEPYESLEPCESEA